MFDRWVTHREEWGLDAAIENRTIEYVMLAAQGPAAPALVGAETDLGLGEMYREVPRHGYEAATPDGESGRGHKRDHESDAG